MEESSFTSSENKFITFIARSDTGKDEKDLTKTDIETAQQNYMKYLHRSLPIRRKIRNKIIEKVIKESRERSIIELRMKSQKQAEQRHLQIIEKQKTTKKYTFEQLFIRQKGTSQRYYYIPEKRMVSRRKHDEIVNRMKEGVE